MQKNKLLLILGLGLMLVPFFGLQAAVATTKTTTPTMSEADKAKLEALKASLNKETEILKANLNTSKTELNKILTDTKGSVKKNLDASAQARIRVIIDKIFTKLSSQASKISLVDSKIALKISDMKKEGVDTTKAEEQYDLAKKALNKANGDILASRILASEQLSQSTSKEVYRSIVKASEESLKTVAGEYRKILPLLVKSN